MNYKYRFLILAVVFLPLSFIFPEGTNNGKEETGKYSFYAETDGAYTFFQDTKYSDVKFSGFGPRLSFGFEKESGYQWGMDMDLCYSKETAATYSNGRTMVLNGVLSAKYLSPLIKTKTQKLFLGGKWDFADLYYREVEGLDNNSQFFTAGSNIKLSCAYIRNISSGLSLEAGIDFQLLSVMTESMSFAFSEPQETLEQGKFSYQDESFLSSFSIRPFWNYLNAGTSVKLHFKNNWTLAYKWNIQRSNEVENYPVTRGSHSISIIYNTGR